MSKDRLQQHIDYKGLETQLLSLTEAEFSISVLHQLKKQQSK